MQIILRDQKLVTHVSHACTEGIFATVFDSIIQIIHVSPLYFLNFQPFLDNSKDSDKFTKDDAAHDDDVATNILLMRPIVFIRTSFVTFWRPDEDARLEDDCAQ